MVVAALEPLLKLARACAGVRALAVPMPAELDRGERRPRAEPLEMEDGRPHAGHRVVRERRLPGVALGPRLGRVDDGRRLPPGGRQRPDPLEHGRILRDDVAAGGAAARAVADERLALARIAVEPLAASSR